MSFLLELIEGGSARGRYSVIGFSPDLIWQAEGETARINRTPITDPAAFVRDEQPTLQSLRKLLAESAITLPESLPPMAAGIFGYMGYDTVRLIENLPEMTPDALGVPDAILIRPTLMLIFDNVKDEMILVTPARPSPGISAEDAYAAALARLQAAIDSLDAPLPHGSAAAAAVVALPEPQSNTSPAEYMAMVAKAKEYIKAGDIFQVVLSQRFSAPFALPSFALYRSLRRLNPSPFLFHLDFGSFQLVGSSPEILVRVRDGEVTIRPIAGTARRGVNDAEDKALAAALLADPKERSEHLMLLDLGRNDVGRVATPGSVTVTDKFVIERYSHVMHIVSNVIGNAGRKQSRRDRCADGRLPGRHRFRGAESSRHGNHRRTRKGEARSLRRMRRIFFGGRRDGYLHRAAHRHPERRHDPRAGGRRHRARQHSRERTAGMHQ